MKNYLEKLVKVVNEDDWNKLKAMDLKTSKLKDYLNILLDNRNHDFPSNQELLTRLKIGDNLHRKMKSVLLNKCYEALAPEGGIQLLDILSRYRLYENFTRELEKQEKEIIKKKPIRERKSFYYYAFHDIRRLPYSMVDVAMIEEYGKKYVQTLEPEAMAEEEIATELKILAIKILKSFFNLQKTGLSSDITKELQTCKKYITQHPSIRLRILLDYVLGFYHFYIDNDDEKSFAHFSKVKKAMSSTEGILFYDEQATIHVFLGLIHYRHDRYKDAILALQDTQKKYAAFVDTQTHVINRLIELHLIEGNIGEAKWLLDNYMRRFLDIGETDSAELASISYIKYYLLADDYDMAYNYLEKARRFLNKKFYLGHDIELRILEVMYFIFTQDFQFAKNLITRGIKFLHEKSKEKDVQAALEKYRLMQRLCKFSNKSKKIPPAFTAKLSEAFGGYQRLLGLLLIKGCSIKMTTL